MNTNIPTLFLKDAYPSISIENPKLEYKKGIQIYTFPIKNVEQRPERCPHCGHEGLHIHKTKRITLKHCSLGLVLIQLMVIFHSYRCPKCRHIHHEKIPFREGLTFYTTFFKQQILFRLDEFGTTMSHVAYDMHATPRQIKDIKKEYLKAYAGNLKPKHYSRYIAVDEFLLEHPHRYCTIIIDAETGELLYLEKGKSKDQIKHFIKFVGDDFMNHVQAVAMDMNNTYYHTIADLFPHIDVCYDTFHLLNWYQVKVIDSVRKEEYKKIKKEANKAAKQGDNELSNELLEKAKLIFDSRSCLLTSKKALLAKDAANKKYNEEIKQSNEAFGLEVSSKQSFRSTDNYEKLKTVLASNENLATAYVLEDDLRQILKIRNQQEMIQRLSEWKDTAKHSKIKQLTWFAKTIDRRWDGLISIAKHGITSAKIEGTNAYIKNMRRSAFGYSDFDFFGLLIFEHTHKNAVTKSLAASKPKKVYKRTKKKNNMSCSRQTIFLVERDQNGNCLYPKNHPL